LNTHSCRFTIGHASVYFNWIVGESSAERLPPDDPRSIPIEKIPFATFEEVLKNHGKNFDRHRTMTVMGMVRALSANEQWTTDPGLTADLISTKSKAQLKCNNPEQMLKIQELYSDDENDENFMIFCDIGASSDNLGNPTFWISRL
jgi:hypothetical protein